MVINKENLNEQEIKINTDHDELAKLIFEKILIENGMDEARKQEIKEHLAREDWKEYFQFRLENRENDGWVIAYKPHNSLVKNALCRLEWVLTFPIGDLMKENEKLTNELEKAKKELEELKSFNDWKNINSNFTPELVQEWKKHGFTYEQCWDWLNTTSPLQWNQTIKEPAYYAWLRDVKQVSAEWVLNEGNEEKLGQEFFQWYQEQQFQAQQEQSTK